MTKFNAAFWRWFGDSKVVDAKGRPLVVYHGTDVNFTEFQQTEDIGYHFGPWESAKSRMDQLEVPEEARNYMKVYLRIVNPLRLPDLFDWDTLAVADALLDARVVSKRQAEELQHFCGLEEIRDALAAKGYDGVVYANKTEGGGDSYIVFNPRQIKSATGNAGTWSRTDPDIRRNPAIQWISAPGRLAATVGGVAFSIRHVGPVKSLYWLYANTSRVQWPLGSGYADSVNFSTPGAARKFVEQHLQALVTHYGGGRRNPYPQARETLFAPNPSAPKVSGYEGMRVQYDLSRGDMTKFGEMPTPDHVYQFAKSKDMLDDVRERVYAIYVNNQNKPMGYRLIGSGGRTGAMMDMPVIFGPAMALHARGLLIVHNHPGAKMNFSPDDIAITKRVIASARNLGIEVLDHILATRDGFLSMRTQLTDVFTEKPAAQQNPGRRKIISDHIDWKLVRSLGFTNDMAEAGYVTPNGRLIDFSNKAKGGQAGRKNLEHTVVGGHMALEELAAAGYMRINYDRTGPSDTYIHLRARPTPEQDVVVLDLLYLCKGNAGIELQDGLGEPREHNYGYGVARSDFIQAQDANPKKALALIHRFYDGQEVSGDLLGSILVKPNPVKFIAQQNPGRRKMAKRTPITLYHITPASNVAAIKRSGIMPGQKPMWTGAVGQWLGERGRIYAFTDWVNAVHFAFRLQWGLEKPVAVITFRSDKEAWELDPSPEASMSVRGHWLKAKGPLMIFPEQITSVTALTTKIVQEATKKEQDDWSKGVLKTKWNPGRRNPRWLLLPGTGSTICGNWMLRHNKSDDVWEIVHKGRVEVRAKDRTQAANLVNALMAMDQKKKSRR